MSGWQPWWSEGVVRQSIVMALGIILCVTTSEAALEPFAGPCQGTGLQRVVAQSKSVGRSRFAAWVNMRLIWVASTRLVESSGRSSQEKKATSDVSVPGAGLPPMISQRKKSL